LRKIPIAIPQIILTCDWGIITGYGARHVFRIIQKPDSGGICGKLLGNRRPHPAGGNRHRLTAAPGHMPGPATELRPANSNGMAPLGRGMSPVGRLPSAVVCHAPSTPTPPLPSLFRWHSHPAPLSHSKVGRFFVL